MPPLLQARITALLSAVLLLCLSAAVPARAADFKIVMTTDPVHMSTAASTSCNDRIYAVIGLPAPTTGTHVLEGRWFKPDGKQQEYTRVPLAMPPPGQSSLQLWLKIERAGDAVDVLFTPTDDDEEFDGEWTLVVYFDRKKVAVRKFHLHCA